jgi:hypothetical protein
VAAADRSKKVMIDDKNPNSKSFSSHSPRKVAETIKEVTPTIRKVDGENKFSPTHTG